ncbi:MAG TPA: response regulator [Pseudorhodoferax sp.]|jgi:two-component system probable response regulator PhcQ|nr:response regulator [Pseudorhodoferax sp.]
MNKQPDKILYVDDEAMALKYFERLVSPLAPVLTASSVEAGKALLAQHADEIAVLVSDQRMPGAYGNELLRHAHDNHPNIVRMLTTAYSELGEAIEAINSGHIYRYITKPWDLESLRADLKNALELAALRSERDALLREKLMVQQQQLLAERVTQLVVACAGFVRPDNALRIDAFLRAASVLGCRPPQINWHQTDHADLMQAETARSIALGQELAAWGRWFSEQGSSRPPLAVLDEALAGAAEIHEGRLLVRDRAALVWPLEAPTPEPVTAANTAWLAWLLWAEDTAALQPQGEGQWLVVPGPLPAPDSLRRDWMAAAIERIAEEAAAA